MLFSDTTWLTFFQKNLGLTFFENLAYKCTFYFLFSEQILLDVFWKNIFFLFSNSSGLTILKRYVDCCFLKNILTACYREYITCYFPEDVPGCYQKHLFPNIRILLHIFKPFSLYTLPCILYKHVEVENKLRTIKRF